ncbi:MAG: type III secretion system cytoplasmic ring protein SctQ [Simkaniaceae bacterium]|nr:MAG: type III secretion system cytoplasmic ring protein SctQ [Simkaniaceae bacterium]
MSTASESWIKRVESVALGAQEIPMWGSLPAFPWKAFTKELSTSLGVKNLKVSAGSAEWKKGSSILTGMGRSPLQLAIELSPLKESFSLVFPSEDFSKLSSWAIHPDAGKEGFSDPYLQKGFFRYLCAESMEILEKLQLFPGLSPKLIDMPLAKEDAYCIDIAIEHEGETIWGRMICPTLFQESMRHHYAQDWTLSLPSTLYESFFADVSISAGRTTLTQEGWKKIQAGDFVILDHCSYYPNLKKGTFQLEFENTPLFQAKIKEENIKILDYAHYFEENKMDDENYEESFGEPMEEEAVSVEESPKEPMVSPKKVPVSLTVEVARLKMSLDKLLKLKPGNVIELGVQVEKGVNLVANGQCVGKGELLQLGDVIGVKITKLGE